MMSIIVLIAALFKLIFSCFYDDAFIHTIYCTFSLCYILVHRGKQTSRKAEADSLKGKESEEDGGGGVRVKGGGGVGATAEKGEEKKAQGGSRLPTLEHYLKHNS